MLDITRNKYYIFVLRQPIQNMVKWPAYKFFVLVMNYINLFDSYPWKMQKLCNKSPTGHFMLSISDHKNESYTVILLFKFSLLLHGATMYNRKLLLENRWFCTSLYYPKLLPSFQAIYIISIFKFISLIKKMEICFKL